MPLDYLGAVFLHKTHTIPYLDELKTYVPPLILALLLKLYTNGSSNTWERKLHGKVYIVTGGTSGIGAALVKELAKNGAQLVLLTSQVSENADSSAKIWITDYINDLREFSGNEMIYAEDCDLSSLYSIRKFATKWLDSKPARRLDGVICLAGESLPIGKLRTNTIDGVEIQMGINYLSHYHLLTLLEPALRVQPPDRDVRVLLTSCVSQNMGEIDTNDLLWSDRSYPSNKPWKVYGTSKLQLNMFAKEFQRRVSKIERPDKQPCGVRINIINPGIVRSPSTRRFLSFGTIWGLILYILMYPIYWLLIKSCEMGMQSFLFAINAPSVYDGPGGLYIKECSIIKEVRKELHDVELQKVLYDNTALLINELEKTSARKRVAEKAKDSSGKDKKKVNKEDSASSKVSQVSANLDKNAVFASAFSDLPGFDPLKNPLGTL
ncbi:putative oxidoreductase [Pichia kluyveri]|uniref:Oxidoreductase n=1 Tax=Pichia kluyveri TaxID=36015 RepID=A0AAV5R8E8_PICKL|nr:putative oxidoreductase [Pichia kluyveri]